MKWLITILILWFLVCCNWLTAASNLVVQVLNWDGTPAGGLKFSGFEEATINEPWVHSHQYLRVIYNSDEAIWGVNYRHI